MNPADAVLKELRKFGLAYPQAHTKSPWPGHLDLAVNDKTFAYLSIEGEPFSISCKLPQSSSAALMLPFAQPTGYGLGKSGWVSAQFSEGDIPPVDLLKSWIDESYRAQAPKKLVALLASAGQGARVARTPSEGGRRPSSRQSKSSTKAGTRAKPGARDAVVLLSGGNPQIAKADGDVPVQAYIAALPGWKRDIGKALDALIVRNVPNVRKAVKWNSPFYGIERRGWFLSFHVFSRYVKVTFFRGKSLRPAPPGGGTKDARWLDLREGALDEGQLSKWVKRAAALPGWIP